MFGEPTMNATENDLLEASPIHLRRLPIGAEAQVGGGVHFRVWAPDREQVDVVCENPCLTLPLEAEEDNEGFFSGFAADLLVGTRYRYRLDGADAYPDPASRYQPEGPHGPSEVVDPSRYSWTDSAWQGRCLKGQIIYEMHIGTFTKEGTFQAAARQLDRLAEMGITVLELMPLAEFAGRFGWGYDGVNLFAPYHYYGTPDDLRDFVNLAHSLGLAVIHDVVYNHLGPDGNYLKPFSEDYFSKTYTTDWGEAINFDGPNNGPVRDYFAANAAYWIEEFHMDGLRIDATQNIYDSSPDHILALMARRVRDAARGRATILINENEPQHTKLVRPVEQGGYGLDGLWNDDFHHSAIVALTGRNEAYYSDYLGTPQEFIAAAKYGYLYQGQWYRWQKQKRGTSTRGVPPHAFVTFIENHDQLANSGMGRRVHTLTSPGRHRAMTALLLLGPGTPMLFQGQEFSASNPFLYFADHNPELAKLVAKGRAEFLAQFPSLSSPEMQHRLADPGDEDTFERCKLDHEECSRHVEAAALHRDLLKLRQADPTFSQQRPGGVDGCLLTSEAFLLRFFGEKPDKDRLLFVNFGKHLTLSPANNPLLAPPDGFDWHIAWSSEDPDYGGQGAPPHRTDAEWIVSGEAAVVMIPGDILVAPSKMPNDDVP